MGNKLVVLQERCSIKMVVRHLFLSPLRGHKKPQFPPGWGRPARDKCSLTVTPLGTVRAELPNTLPQFPAIQGDQRTT